MAARNDETYLFVVEWYDPMPQLRRKYLLKYFTEQHAVSFFPSLISNPLSTAQMQYLK